MQYLTVLVTELRNGDQWYTDKDTTYIESVDVEEERVMVRGRGRRGWGKSKKIRAWSFVLDQKLDIMRGS